MCRSGQNSVSNSHNMWLLLDTTNGGTMVLTTVLPEMSSNLANLAEVIMHGFWRCLSLAWLCWYVDEIVPPSPEAICTPKALSMVNVCLPAWIPSSLCCFRRCHKQPLTLFHSAAARSIGGDHPRLYIWCLWWSSTSLHLLPKTKME